jgi:hypothetical protein
MRILDIYKRFNIPPNLREHMIRVYGIICFFQNHWTGGPIDWNVVKKMALLHDMGNLVKFNFDKFPEFLGSEITNIDYWRQAQSQFIQKYGSNDHEATKKILIEIGLNPQIIDAILSKNFKQSETIMSSQYWPTKLLHYADMRVIPAGIGSLEDRIADIRLRYSHVPDLEAQILSCRKIETQIQSQLNISVQELSDKTVKVELSDLATFEI